MRNLVTRVAYRAVGRRPRTILLGHAKGIDPGHAHMPLRDRLVLRYPLILIDNRSNTLIFYVLERVFELTKFLLNVGQHFFTSIHPARVPEQPSEQLLDGLYRKGKGEGKGKNSFREKAKGKGYEQQ